MKNYLTLKDMGSSGGLCSQLQIYASMLAVAEANDMEIVFSEDMVKNIGVGIRIFDLLDLEYSIKPNNFFDEFINKPINFHTTRFDTSLFPLSPKGDYNLIGRFDLYTYWYNSIGDEVSKWEFKSELQTSAESRIAEIKSQLGDKPTVSIHVRRGDYLINASYVCTEDYYKRAIIELDKKAQIDHIYIVSDDIP